MHLAQWAAAALLLASMPRPAAAESFPVRLQDGASWTVTFERTTAPEQATVRVTRRVTWWADGAGGQLLVEPVSAEVVAGPREAGDQAALDFPYGLKVDAGLRPVAFTDKAAVLAAVRQWLLRAPRMAEALPTLEQRAPNLVELTAWALATQELTLLAQAQGLSFGASRILQRRGEIPNPLGGSAMASTDTLVLEPFDARAGVAVVSFRREPDLDSLRASVASMIRAFDQRAGRKLDQAEMDRVLEQSSIALGFTCRHELDPATGLALRATCARSFRMEVAGRVKQQEERWSLEQDWSGPAR